MAYIVLQARKTQPSLSCFFYTTNKLANGRNKMIFYTITNISYTIKHNNIKCCWALCVQALLLEQKSRGMMMSSSMSHSIGFGAVSVSAAARVRPSLEQYISDLDDSKIMVGGIHPFTQRLFGIFTALENSRQLTDSAQQFVLSLHIRLALRECAPLVPSTPLARNRLRHFTRQAEALHQQSWTAM